MLHPSFSRSRTQTTGIVSREAGLLQLDRVSDQLGLSGPGLRDSSSRGLSSLFSSTRHKSASPDVLEPGTVHSLES